MPASSFADSLHLLRSRRFGTFWCASLLSSVGTWAQQVAQPWLLLSLGASSFLVGLDAFAMSAPVWLLTLPGGVLADRADRRRVIAGFQSVQMLCPLAIVVLLVAGGLQPWIVILLSLVAAALNPLFWLLPLILGVAGASMSVTNTSSNALLQTAAPAHLRGRTVSVYMLAMRGGLAIGSLVTGALVAHFGIRETLLVNGALALVVQLALGLAWSRAPAPTPGAGTGRA